MNVSLLRYQTEKVAESHYREGLFRRNRFLKNGFLEFKWNYFALREQNMYFKALR
jgi:hypothetical protein